MSASQDSAESGASDPQNAPEGSVTADRARSPVALPDGTRLRDEYRVESVLGAGSFGITYRAHDEHLHTSVAIKEYYPRDLAGRSEGAFSVRPHTGENDEAFAFGLEQFMQEGRRIARFDHPNIVDVRSYFEENGTGYLVMDYYEGQTLAEHLAENGGRLSEDEALALIQDVLSGLRPVHADGVLHRDIDPQNVYRTTDGTALLIDFGAAREAMGARSQSLEVILKPGYAPIEQYSARGDQGPHTDVYACAATLYKCLTGVKPPEAPERVQEDELVPPREVRPEISMETSVAVRKGLAVYPDRRPSSVEEFSSLLGGTRTAQQPTKVPTQDGAPAHPTVDDVSGNTEGKQEIQATDQSTLDSAPPAAPDRSSAPSATSIIGTGLGIAGVIGATLLLSETGPVEVLSFFGTWIAVSVGLVVLFREGEKAMSLESRAAVSDWLLQETFVERPSNWPKTFTTLFDAVFTEKHLSWRCFGRSAIASVITASILFFGAISLDYLPIRFFPGSSLFGALSFIAWACTLNVLIDYVSLYETRWVLGRMSQSKSTATHLGYLALDLALTQTIFALIMGAITGVALMQGYMTLLEWINRILDFYIIFYNPFHFINFSPMAYTTLFTSVWVWLYVGAGLLLRALRPVLESLDWLKRHLDVETRPVHAMGLLLALLTSLGFAAGAPFVL